LPGGPGGSPPENDRPVGLDEAARRLGASTSSWTTVLLQDTASIEHRLTQLIDDGDGPMAN
jgi:hypothetical protein